MMFFRLLAISIFCLFINQSLIAQSASLSSITIGPHEVGTAYTVEVQVGDPDAVSDLFGISFQLVAGSSSTEYVSGSAAEGDFLGTDVIAFPESPNAQTVDFAVTRKSGAGGVNGSGIVMSAEFITSQAGPVTFSLEGVEAVDPSGSVIPVELSDLTIDVIETPPPTLTVSPTALDFESSAGSQTFEVTSNLDSWLVSADADWITVSDASGSGDDPQVTVAVTENTGSATRIGTITVEGEGLSESIQVTQNAPVSPPESASVSVKSSGPFEVGTAYTVEVQVGDPDAVSDLFGISFQLVAGSSSTEYVSGSAAEGDFLGTDVIAFPESPNAQTVDFAVTRKSGAGGVNGSGIVMSAEFITSQAGPVTFSLEGVEAVDPSGSVIPVELSDLTIDVIETPPPTLTVSPTALDFESSAGSQTFEVTSNLDSWLVSADADWITVSDASGSGDDPQVTVAVTENTGSATRIGTITVEGEGLSESIQVTQDAPIKFSITTSENNSDWGSTSGGGTYEEGQTVEVVATAAEGYQFVRWTEGGNEVSTSASYGFTASQDRDLVAVFEEIGMNEPPAVSIVNGPIDGSIINFNDPGFVWEGEDTDGTVVAYDVELQGPGSTGFTTTETFFQFEGLSDGAYLFRVRAIDNESTTSDWAERSFTISSGPGSPIVQVSPANNAVNVPLDSSFEWEPVEGADRYELHYNATNPIEMVVETFVESTEFTPSEDLLANRTFDWRVRAIKGETAGDWSPIWSFTTTAEPVAIEWTLSPQEVTLPDPSSATVELTIDQTAGTDDLAWSVSSDAGWLTIDGADSGTGDAVVSLTASKNSSEARREATVTVSSNAGQQTATVTQPGDPAPGVAQLESPANGSEITGPDVILRWQAEELANRYKVEVATDASFNDIFFSDTSIQNAFVELQNLESGQLYYWRVRSFSEASGYVDWSEVWNFTKLVVSIDNPERILSFDLAQNYPNPFNPTTQIEYSIQEQANVSLEVFSMLGERVALLVDELKSPGIYSVNFDASNLSSGTYLYRLQAGTYVQTEKMILIK